MTTPSLSRDTHQFRFRGSIAPQKRTPLKAEVTPKTDGSVATIRLYDVIDSWGDPFGISAKEMAAALDELPGNVAQIDLLVNSPGGEAMEGVAILNLLRSHAARITCTVEGLAASAASFIAAGADETVMAQNSQMMIHDAWGLCVGNAQDMFELGTALDKLSDNIASIYAEKAGGTVESWREAMRAETWYNADEVVEAGLADRMIEKPAASQDRFDLTVFAHAGRAEAPEPILPKTEPGSPVDPETAAAEAAAPAAAEAVASPVTAGHLAALSEAEAVLTLG